MLGCPGQTQNFQNSGNKQVFAWVRVHLLCEWYATLVWINHELRFKILCIFTKAPGATLRQIMGKLKYPTLRHQTSMYQ